MSWHFDIYQATFLHKAQVIRVNLSQGKVKLVKVDGVLLYCWPLQHHHLTFLCIIILTQLVIHDKTLPHHLWDCNILEKSTKFIPDTFDFTSPLSPLTPFSVNVQQWMGEKQHCGKLKSTLVVTLSSLPKSSHMDGCYVSANSVKN